MNKLLIQELVQRALQEDIGFQDLTTEAIIDPAHVSTAELLAKQDGVVAGLEVAFTAFRLLDPQANLVPVVADGDQILAGQVLARVKGRTACLLSAERTALNFLQRLSGIATRTKMAVDTVQQYKCHIIDTRKTTPGLRALEKYAVKTGGGYNHRFGLFDAVLIKDNHIAAAGSITKALERVRYHVGHMVKIEVECENLVQVEEALKASPDIIMLDNMDVNLMQKAVEMINGQALTEASGGLTLENLAQVAATGVDLISLGWLTHSINALDISLNIYESAKYTK